MGYYAIDLDGTLAEYHHDFKHDELGMPIHKTVSLIKEMLGQGYDVRILTARVGPQSDDTNVDDVRTMIENWCLEHIGTILIVQNHKCYEMIQLYDDRAIQVELNTGRLM